MENFKISFSRQSVSLETYNDIGNQNLKQVSLGGNNGIQDANLSGISKLKLHFNTSASKEMNRAVLADFKQSLKATYGKLVADMAFDKFIGADAFYKGTKLSSAKIRQAIDFSKSVNDGTYEIPVNNKKLASIAHLRHDFEEATSISIQSPSFKGGQLTFTSLGKGNRANVAKCVRKFAQLNAWANDLLAEFPTDLHSLNDLDYNVKKLKFAFSKWDDDFNAIQQPGNKSDAAPLNNGQKALSPLKGESERIIKMLASKIVEARNVCANNPTSYTSVGKAAVQFFTAMRNCCEEISADAQKLKSACGKSQTMADNFTKTVGLLKNSNIMTMLEDRAYGRDEAITGIDIGKGKRIKKEDIKKLLDKVMPEVGNDVKKNPNWQMTECNAKKRLGKEFNERVSKFICGLADLVAKADGKSMSTTKANLCKSTLPDMINHEYHNVLNEEPWNVIDKNMNIVFDGKSYQCNSTITPASKLEGEVGKLYMEQKDDHGNVTRPAVNGVMSHGYGEKTHAVNLAKSTLTMKLPQPDGKLKDVKVFEGIRHGVNAAVDLKKQEYAEANLNRAKETALAAFTSMDNYKDLITDAMKKAKPNEMPTVHFNMTSVSLLTPDHFRRSKHSDEARMLKGQKAAFDQLATEGMIIKIDGKDVKIMPNILTFNFGVNQGGRGALAYLLGSKTNSDAMNMDGITKLTSQVNNFLKLHGAKTGVLDAEGKVVYKLALQINAMLTNSMEYSTKGGDPFKVASRIAVLTQLIGGVPCWNCKSGKDRTGMMDVECKSLATYIKLKQDVPEIGTISEDQKRLNTQYALEGGNHEMQQYNTGLAGFKLDNDTFKNRVADNMDVINSFIGGSHVVKA